jgi:hypothetical protein
MLLSQWVAETGTPAADIAAAAHVHLGTVYKWLSGRVMPRPTQIAALVRLTGGRVTAADAATAYMAHQEKRVAAPDANHASDIPQADGDGIGTGRSHNRQTTVKSAPGAITFS